MAKGEIVVLSREAKLRAKALGIRRNKASEAKGDRPAHGAPANGTAKSERAHIVGACGEFAVAQLLGLPEPTSINTYRTEPDLPGRLQVRTRESAPDKEKYDHLIVRRNDKDDDIFVLVLVEPPNLRVVGYYFGSQCKKDEYLFGYGNRPKSYFVPPEHLNHIQFLMKQPVRKPPRSADIRW